MSLETGALVMIDALGFRGIWRRFEPATIIAKLHALKDVAEESMKGFDITYTSRAAFLSDTIVIGLTPTGKVADRDAGEALVLLQAGFRVVYLTLLALEKAPPIAYRGCISFGEFEISGPFVLGEAVDEAAAHYEIAEGAFVWLTPSAKAVWDKKKLRIEPPDSCLVPYAVPLKQGASYDTYAVSPFEAESDDRKRRRVRDTLLSTFDTPHSATTLGVQLKRQNTERFFHWVQQPGHLAVRRGGPWLKVRE